MYLDEERSESMNIFNLVLISVDLCSPLIMEPKKHHHFCAKFLFYLMELLFSWQLEFEAIHGHTHTYTTHS